MTEKVIDKSCPFCGGTESIIKGSERICAYCLQPYDLTEGPLSEGYDKLASYNFAGAANFFRSVIDTSGSEAAYGLFLAQNRIEENKQRSTIEPIVYSYHAESFYDDRDFMLLVKAFENNRVFTKKLERIEEARKETLVPKEEYHVVVYYDEQKKSECDSFCERLTLSGYKVLKAVSTTDIDIATLREAGGAYYFAASPVSVKNFLETKAARRYILLESRRMHESGIAKRPLKIIIDEELPEIIKSAACGIADIVPFVGSDAEARRLRHLSSGTASRSTKERTAAPVPEEFKPQRNAEAVAGIRGEEEDIERIRKYLRVANYADAKGLFEKMYKNGCRASRVFFYAFLADAGVGSEENLIKYADSLNISAQAASLLGDAMYYATEEEAGRYVGLLVDVSLSLLDRRRKKEAMVLLDAAFMYDYSDSYADAIIGRINALKNSLSVDDYVALVHKVLTKLKNDDVGYKLKRVYETIDYAISRDEYDRADDIVESVLDFYPKESKLYERKLYCVNRVSSFKEMLSREYPRLGEYFADYLDTLGAFEKQKTLKSFFDALVASAKAKGFDGFENALEEVYDAGEGELFGASECVTIGELALSSGIFAAAEGYFDKAILLDKGCYEAYWGRLKAGLKCGSDRALEECDTPIDRAGDYYEKAHRTGEQDLYFIDRIERVREVQKTVVKKDGHVYRPDDFVVRAGVAVKYVGASEKVYVGGGIAAVSANAFRGSGVKSVLIDGSVKNIGSYAFAYSAIERIYLPGIGLQMSYNPFLGCGALREISGGGVVENGAFYYGGKLVGYYPQMADDRTLLEVRKGTYAVGRKAFFYPGNLREVRFGGGVKIELCAFYGCAGMRITGPVAPEKEATLGEGAFGDCVLNHGVLEASDNQKWSALYRDGTNNMAVSAPLLSGGLTKVTDTDRNVGGGLLIKYGKVIYTVGTKLMAADINGSGESNEIRLTALPSGTGVLWNEYIILPTDLDGGTLQYISPDGKVEHKITLGTKITRPLSLGGDNLACISGDTLYVVNLGTGNFKGVRTSEKLTCVPCYAGGKFVVAGEKHVYAFNERLEGGAVRELRGKEFRDGTGKDKKICRGRIVSYGGVAYWMELAYSNSLLVYYDGERIYTKNLPASAIYFASTQPIFYGGKLYCASEYAVVSSPIPSAGEDWSFSEGEQFSRKFSELAIAGGAPYLCYGDGGEANLRFRGFYGGKAVLYDVVSGGIYVV